MIRERRVRLYLAFMAKVPLYSLPILGLLAALNPLPVVIENVVSGRAPGLGTIEPTITALKLWALFVAAMLAVGSAVYWSSTGRSRDS